MFCLPHSLCPVLPSNSAVTLVCGYLLLLPALLQSPQIDWHDFVIVETIDFYEDEDEELPPPMSLKELIAFNKQQAQQGGGAAAAAAAAAGEEDAAMEEAEDAEQVGACASAAAEDAGTCCVSMYALYLDVRVMRTQQAGGASGIHCNALAACM